MYEYMTNDEVLAEIRKHLEKYAETHDWIVQAFQFRVNEWGDPTMNINLVAGRRLGSPPSAERKSAKRAKRIAPPT